MNACSVVMLSEFNSQFPEDEQVAKRVEPMLTRIRLQTEMQTMPVSILFSRDGKLKFSTMLAS